MQAEVAPGAAAAGPKPQDGDLVIAHVTVRDPSNDLVLFSTRRSDGGAGAPLAFIIGKGAARPPRCWELALYAMARGGRKVVRARPDYGYAHPDCGMAPPKGVDAARALAFDLELLGTVSGEAARGAGDGDALLKVTLTESDKWEMARAPNEVAFRIRAAPLSEDGALGGGAPYFAPRAPLSARLGAGLLSAGVEEALATMAQGERAAFVVPAALLAAAAPSSSGAALAEQQQQQHQQQQQELLVPPPPPGLEQVALELELLELVQVRDMTGDGGVLKRRVRAGRGEFPVDCPLNDAAVRLHVRARPHRAGAADAENPWVYDSRRRATAGGGSGGGAAAAAAEEAGGDAAGGSGGGDGDAPPLEVETGCGELPEAVELCARLMVPGELARATARPRYAYANRDDAPPGLDAASAIEFEIELVDFEREGHWGNLGWAARWALLERLKGAGNALYKAGKFKYASARYRRMLQLIDSTRDFEDDGDDADADGADAGGAGAGGGGAGGGAESASDRADAFKLAALGNLALCELGLGEPARAVEWCDKALKLEPQSAKVCVCAVCCMCDLCIVCAVCVCVGWAFSL